MNKLYFSHDEGARKDPKLVDVLMTLGHEGKSVYWDLVEMLYEQGGYLTLSQCKVYAFDLRTTCELLTKLVNDFELFANDGTAFWSESVLERMKLRAAKSERRAAAGSKGGKARAEREAVAKALAEQGSSIATALPNDSQAIKGNEIKVKKSTSDDVPALTPAPVDLASPLQAATPNDPRRAAAAFRPDEAPVFTIAGLKAFTASIGFAGIDMGYYLPLMQRAAEKTGEQRPNDGPGKTWEDFVTYYLQLERKYNRVVYPLPVGQQQPPGPNAALQVTTATTSFNVAARAAEQKTNLYL